MEKSPGAPVLLSGDGSARFFFSRVRFARRVQSDFPVHEPGKLDDSPPCALSFGRAFSDVKRPATTRTSRTRARTGDGRTNADSARSCRDRIARAARGSGGIARVRHASTDRPDVRKTTKPLVFWVSLTLRCPAGSSTTFQTRTTDPAAITNISRRPRRSRKGASGGWRRIPDASRGTARAKRRSGRATSRFVSVSDKKEPAQKSSK